MKEENNFFQLGGENKVHAFNKNKKIQTNWRKLKMSIKKKLAMGIATGALAVSMIGGGTYAWFNDVEYNNSTFSAGTLDINVAGNDAENAIIDVGTMKPGDTMTRAFKLNNTGSLDVSKVLLQSEYSVGDWLGDNNGADFGEHIKVTVLTNIDKRQVIVLDTTLAKLSQKDVVEKQWFNLLGGEKSGITAGTSDDFIVTFHFHDNGKNQNIFQGDNLKLKWTFDAKQTPGNLLK